MKCTSYISKIPKSLMSQYFSLMIARENDKREQNTHTWLSSCKKLCKYILGSAQCFKDIFRMVPYCLVRMVHVILHFAPNIGELLPSGV